MKWWSWWRGVKNFEIYDDVISEQPLIRMAYEDADDLLPVPFVDGFDVSEYHAVFSFFEVFRHGDFGVLFVLGLPHELDVLATLLQVFDVHLFRLDKLLQPVLPLLYRLLHGITVRLLLACVVTCCRSRRRRLLLRRIWIITAFVLVVGCCLWSDWWARWRWSRRLLTVPITLLLKSNKKKTHAEVFHYVIPSFIYTNTYILHQPPCHFSKTIKCCSFPTTLLFPPDDHFDISFGKEFMTPFANDPPRNKLVALRCYEFHRIHPLFKNCWRPFWTGYFVNAQKMKFRAMFSLDGQKTNDELRSGGGRRRGGNGGAVEGAEYKKNGVMLNPWFYSCLFLSSFF